MKKNEAAIVAWGFALLVLFGCAVFGPERKPKPQSWEKSRGPVVPHDKFPADCSLCHEAGGWHKIREDFVFDHKKETGVALTGAHADGQCLRCHNDRGPVANFARRGCRGCHDDVHRGTMGVRCETCHSENDWLPVGAMAAHGRTRFPLMGPHAAVACSRCHKNAGSNEFTGADPRCISCHRDDLARTTNPPHLQVGWTSDCEKCHNGLTWAGRFNHLFNISSGPHRVACIQCHTTPGDYKFANCLNCHSKAETDGHHSDVSGYSYANAACINCHPTGRRD